MSHTLMEYRGHASQHELSLIISRLIIFIDITA